MQLSATSQRSLRLGSSMAATTMGAAAARSPEPSDCDTANVLSLSGSAVLSSGSLRG